MDAASARSSSYSSSPVPRGSLGTVETAGEARIKCRRPAAVTSATSPRPRGAGLRPCIRDITPPYPRPLIIHLSLPAPGYWLLPASPWRRHRDRVVGAETRGCRCGDLRALSLHRVAERERGFGGERRGECLGVRDGEVLAERSEG